MSSEAVRAILEPKLEIGWNGQTSITWDNVDRNALPGESFIACELSMTHAVPKGMTCQRETHLFIIEVYTKHGISSASNMVMAGELCAMFFNFNSGNLLIKAVRDERVGDVKEHYQRNVIIDVQYDHHF